MGKGKKIALTIVGVIVGLIVLLLIVVFTTTSGVDQAAEDIIADFHNGNAEMVFNESPISEEMTFNEFEQALLVGTPQDLTQAEKQSWTGRGFENGVKYITGNFILPSGEEISLKYSFIKEGGEYILVGIVPVE